MQRFKSKPRNKVSKALCQRVHARKRAIVRYKFELNRHDRKEIVSLIKRGKATLVEKQSNRVYIYNLWYGKIPVQVVYDKSRGELSSFLPPENLLRDGFTTRQQLEDLGLVKAAPKPVLVGRFMDAIEKMNGESIDSVGSSNLDNNSSDDWSSFEI